MTTVREALAELNDAFALEPAILTGRQSAALDIVRAALSAPPQEPVAWQRVMDNGKPADWIRFGPPLADQSEQWRPLYAHPPAAQEPAQAAPDALFARLEAYTVSAARADPDAAWSMLCDSYDELARLRAELAEARNDWRRDLRLEIDAHAKTRTERDAARADAGKWLNLLRGHAIVRNGRILRCNICEAEWGGEDGETHGRLCPLDAARELAP